ncbi:MAG: cell division protein [Alphaproteobacteria bacterium]|jgi:cell division transport system permease protein|nr:cell division protein [Alphaproteobacteria bacterium]
MLGGRTDFSIVGDPSTRLLPWIVGVMVYLAGLMLAVALMLSGVAADWSQGLEAKITVQVAPGEDEDEVAVDKRVVATVRVLLKTPGIAAARPLPKNEIMTLLEPWLGAGISTADLPLPRVIDVTLEDDRRPDLAALAKRLAEAAPGSSIESHEYWRRNLVDLIGSIEAVAAVMIGLIALVAVTAVVFTTRSGLAVHHEVIEVLHLIGAQDDYIARQFQRQALALALKGSIGGTALTLLTLVAVGRVAADLDSTLLPPVALHAWHWAVLALLPVPAAYVAMITARRTVMRVLARMV